VRTASLAALASVLLLAGCGDDANPVDGGGPVARSDSGPTEKKPREEDVLPAGGEAPEVDTTRLEGAARAAGCELESFRAKSREHVSDPGEKVKYSSAPPTSGRHSEVAAGDAAYLTPPDEKALVHSLEHGRVVIWFDLDLPPAARSSLRALYEEDAFQTLLTPDETGSDYEVAATAWNGDPAPNGTGRLLGCEKYTPRVFEALQAFKRKHRGKGPEAIP